MDTEIAYLYIHQLNEPEIKMDNAYELICIRGETEGEKIDLLNAELPIVSRFLRASLEWSLASATDAITHDPEQPVFVEHMEAMAEMMEEMIFDNKWQARSTWVLNEK